MAAWRLALTHPHPKPKPHEQNHRPQTPSRAQKDVIFLKVNKLSSVKTQLPYEYYSLPYCRPERIVPFAENLGEVLRGDRIENSLYQIQMRADEQCRVLCRIEKLTAAQAKAFADKIADDYKVNM